MKKLPDKIVREKNCILYEIEFEDVQGIFLRIHSSNCNLSVHHLVLL